MPANNKDLITANGKPAPQYFNDVDDQYQAVKGDKGSPYAMIVDAAGNPVSSTNKLPVSVQFPTTQDVKLTGSNIEQLLGDISKMNLREEEVVPKQPYPPRMIANSVNGYLEYIGIDIRARALDEEGNLYATDGGIRIKKCPIENVENSASWVTVWQLPNEPNSGQINATALMVTKTKRIVVATQKGWVYVSDETQTSFADTGIRMPTNTEGTQFSFCNVQFGYGQYENLVWLSSYGEKPIISNKVYLSEDYGATFTEKTSIPYINTTYNTHIHDIQYDPFADRFWVVFGDQRNSQTFYSDDKCITWKPLFGDFADDLRNTQMTSIAVFPHGIAFASDHAKSPDYPNNNMEDNIRFLPRTKGQFRDIPDPSKLEVVHRPSIDANFHYFAMKVSQIKIDDYIVTLMPWYGVDKNIILTASIDGRNWYEIFKGEQLGAWQIAGVHPMDTEKRIFGYAKNKSGTTSLLKMPLPEWI